MYGYIYLTENLINGKKYIGKHRSEQFDEQYIGSGKILTDAIKKYGKEAFRCTILPSINNIPTICDTAEQLNESEIYYIDYFNCVQDDNYYNLKSGGDGGWDFQDWSGANNGMYGVHRFGADNPNYGKHHTFSDESKQHMSAAKKGRPVAPFTTEHKQKLSEARKKRITSDETKAKMSLARQGKRHSEETKKKMSEHNGMRSAENRKKVSQALKGRISPCKNTIWVHLGDTTKMIHSDELDEYLKLGYTRGRK